MRRGQLVFEARGSDLTGADLLGIAEAICPPVGRLIPVLPAQRSLALFFGNTRLTNSSRISFYSPFFPSSISFFLSYFDMALAYQKTVNDVVA